MSTLLYYGLCHPPLHEMGLAWGTLDTVFLVPQGWGFCLDFFYLAYLECLTVAGLNES